MIQGHTKFSCDRHFGLAKIQYKKEETVEDFATIVEIIKSSSKNNVVVPIRDPIANKAIVSVFNWKAFLANRYNRCDSTMKIFNSHYFSFKKGNDKIEYRAYFDGDVNFANLVKKKRNLWASLSLCSVKI